MVVLHKEDFNNKNICKEIPTMNLKIFDRLDQGIDDDSDVSSGRFTIWKTVFNKLDFKGHHANSRFHVTYSSIRRYTNNAHNFILQAGYFYGIQRFIFSFILFIYYIYVIARRTVLGLSVKKL